jgi:hypothetical protein
MRGRILFIVAVVVFIALVPAMYWVLFERGLSVSSPSSQPPLAPTGLEAELVDESPEQAPLALSVTDLEGEVQITRGEGGQWRSAEVGMVLAAQDKIRTLIGSQATLSMPGVFSVRVNPQSEFKVRKLAENAYRFLLSEGMIAADVMDDPDRIFEVNASTAVATTRGGAFRMHVNEAGLVALGTSRGTVDLEAGGKVVQVQSGYMARVQRDKVPEDPIRIPKNLFLKVQWPSKRDHAKRKLQVAGRTDPGARLRVDGLTVEVDPRGRFKTVVALREGLNRVRVEAEDVGGNQNRLESPTLKVDTRGDGFQINTSPEMWKKQGRPKPP